MEALQSVTFMYFWLNYCDENHIERTPVALLFNMANEIIEADKLHLFLLSGGTRFDDNEYLGSLGNSIELTVCAGGANLEIVDLF